MPRTNGQGNMERHLVPIEKSSRGEARSFMPVSRTRRLTSQEWDSEEDQKFRDNIESIRASLESIADFSNTVKKWTPWAIAFIGVAYPTIGKLISQLPPIPH